MGRQYIESMRCRQEAQTENIIEATVPGSQNTYTDKEGKLRWSNTDKEVKIKTYPDGSKLYKIKSLEKDGKPGDYVDARILGNIDIPIKKITEFSSGLVKFEKEVEYEKLKIERQTKGKVGQEAQKKKKEWEVIKKLKDNHEKSIQRYKDLKTTGLEDKELRIVLFKTFFDAALKVPDVVAKGRERESVVKGPKGTVVVKSRWVIYENEERDLIDIVLIKRLSTIIPIIPKSNDGGNESMSCIVSYFGKDLTVITEDVITERPNLTLYEGDVDTLEGIEKQERFYFSQSIQDLVDIIEDGHWTDEFPSVLSALGQKEPNTCMEMCKYVLEKKLGDDFTQYSAVNEIQNLIEYKKEHHVYKWNDEEMLRYTEKCINENAKIKSIMEDDF